MMPDLNCDLFKIAEIQCDVSLQYAFVRVKHVVHMYFCLNSAVIAHFYH